MVGEVGNLITGTDEAVSRPERKSSEAGALCLVSLNSVVGEGPWVPAGCLQSVAQHSLDKLECSPSPRAALQQDIEQPPSPSMCGETAASELIVTASTKASTTRRFIMRTKSLMSRVSLRQECVMRMDALYHMATIDTATGVYDGESVLKIDNG